MSVSFSLRTERRVNSKRKYYIVTAQISGRLPVDLFTILGQLTSIVDPGGNRRCAGGWGSASWKFRNRKEAEQAIIAATLVMP